MGFIWAVSIVDELSRLYPLLVGGLLAFLGYRETRRMNNATNHLSEDKLGDERATQLIEGYKDLLPATMASYEARLKHMEQVIQESQEVIRVMAKAQVDNGLLLASAQGHTERCEIQLVDLTARLRLAEARIAELGG